MGLPWIQVAKEFPSSPEAFALGAALQVGTDAAVGMAVRFWCWAADHAQQGTVDGAFSALMVDEAARRAGFAEAMVSVGLLERLAGGFRIVGWDRYAKALEKAAGDAERKRTRRRNGAGTARAVPVDDRADGAGKSQIESQSQMSSSYEEDSAPRPIGFTVEPPDKPPELWTGEDFWRFLQDRRKAAGHPPEKWPNLRDLGSWWSACLMTEGVTPHAMKEGVYAFGQDEYWEKRGYPFAAFRKGWGKYVKLEVAHAHAANG